MCVDVYVRRKERESEREERGIERKFLVAVSCSVLQCVAVRCSVMQCVAACCGRKTRESKKEGQGIERKI